jgi:ABC-type multidrug transport system ATPase subunit
LSHEETRAVAMAEAVTSSVVTVLLIEEPLVAIDARAAARLGEALRARSREGVAVVVTTASVRDAIELADDHVLLKSGVIVGRARSLDELAGLSPRGARVRMLVSDPRPLAAALAREEDVEAVARRDMAVVARGRDAVQLARAAARAIIASGVDVIELRIEAPTLDEARAAVAATPDPAR